MTSWFILLCSYFNLLFNLLLFLTSPISEAFPLMLLYIALIVIGTCLALLVMLIVAVQVYKKRKEDSTTGPLKYTFSAKENALS